MVSRKNISRGVAVVLSLALGISVSGVSDISASAKKKICLNSKSVTLKIGEKKKLKVKNTTKKVTWKSSNKKVATVSSKGILSAKKEGKTTVTATVGKKAYKCKVTVVKLVEQVTPTPEPEKKTETWEEAKISGSEEAFQTYFSVNMKEYTKQQEDTVLGEIESITYDSKVVGASREAYVYLPPNYSKDKTYPVLYMIHGIGCDRGQWKSMTLNQILSNMICREEVVPFVAVIPSVIPKNGLNKVTLSEENIQAFTLFEEEFLQDLEPYIFSHYSVSQKMEDTGVCGLSMGGMEALRLGFGLKEHFNYIGSFSAAPTLDTSVLNTDGWSKQPDMVLLCSGSKDFTVDHNPKDYHFELQKNGVDHIWYLYPNGGHTDTVWKNGLVNFLKRSFQKK